MTSNNDPIIQFQDVTVRRGNVLALDHVSFSVDRGEYVGIIGPNGAGKTTLLLTLLGLIEPSEGNVFVSRDAHVGYVPQKYLPNSTFPVSVEEIIAMGFSRRSVWKRKQEQEQIRGALASVGLPESFLWRNFSSLSGGQKQRVIIARSLAHNANLLLFDEPTSGIDHATKIRIYELLAKLNTERDMTILFVSHEVEHVVKACKCVLCLDRHLHEGCAPMDFTGRDSNQGEVSTDIIPVKHTKQKKEKHKSHMAT